MLQVVYAADVIYNYSEHPGIKLIKEQSIGNYEFSFNPVTPYSALLKLNKLNVKKHMDMILYL